MLSASLQQLLLLLADGQFHSGTELAQSLAISRSGVWKQLQALEALGLELTAISGKGYRLQRPLHLLQRQSIEEQLLPSVLETIRQLDIFPVIASTNGYLVQLAQKSPLSGCVCLAEYQSAGKGRRGRSWISPFGHNIYLSLLWRYQSGPGAIAGLSMAVGIAVVRALRQAGVEGVGLKWPNDIYWQQRKLAGILIEVSGETSGPCQAVIGIGLNFYLPPQQAAAIDQAWVDLQTILGENVMQRRNSIAALLLNELMPVVSNFEQQTLQHYLDEWRSFDCMAGKTATVHIGEQRFTGCVRGIDDQGLLLLEVEAGNVRRFASGEVSLRAA